MSDTPKQENIEDSKPLTDEETQANQESTTTTEPESPAVEETIKPAEPANEPDQTDEKKPSKAPLLLAILALLLVLGLAGFGHYRFEQLTQQLAGENAALESALSDETQRFNSQLTAISEDLSQAQQDREAQNVLVDRLQARLTDAIKQVEAGRQTTEADWRLAEAEYLLRLANQRILMEKRPEGALAMLRSTDKILRELDDVTLFNLREAIANEIAALEAIPKLDIEGTYLRLSAMIRQTAALATLSVEQQRELPDMLSEITPDLIDETLQEEMQSSFASAMSRLEKLVIVQHHDEPIEPLLSPEQGYQLRQSLQLLLEQTQLAMLRQQQKIYDQSLTTAAELIERYFDNNAANTQAILAGIKELQPLQVSPVMPDISGSLTLLQDHIAEMTKLGAEARQ